MDSTELEKLLREDFYDGESFRQLLNEPLLYSVPAWMIVGYLRRLQNAPHPDSKHSAEQNKSATCAFSISPK